MPVAGSQGKAELEKALEQGMLQDEAERLSSLADEDDLDDETAELVLSVISELETRLERIEARD